MNRDQLTLIRLGRTELMVSPVGFGSYRVHERDPHHRQALEHALAMGCNLIDTSANYTDGSSERVIGQTLEGLLRRGHIRREEIVVVTKAGYVQGENMALAKKKIQDGSPFPEMVQFSEDCWHCISPEFLEDQISRSLARLRLPSIDVLLLHNPEYFLKAEGDHKEYYERIRRAFTYLEKEAQRGRIRWYGISSNTFPDSKESPEYTSLEAVYEIAESISPSHHFGVIQLPFNLYEPGAFFEQNNSSKTVTEYAALKDLGVLTNRPLNAFYGNAMVRLADFPSHPGEDVEDRIQSTISRAMEIETQKSKDLPTPWGHVLRKSFDKVRDLDHWKQIRDWQVTPSLTHCPDDYREVVQSLCQAVTAFFETRASENSQRIARALDGACPALTSSKTLSQKVIRVYRSVPGIHCVLVGMRKPDYVNDALGLQPPLTAEQAVDAIEAAPELLDFT